MSIDLEERVIRERGEDGRGKMTVRSEQGGAKVLGKRRADVILSNACHSSVVKFYSGAATNGPLDGVANQEFVTREPLLNECPRFQKSRAFRLITLLNFR